MNALVEAALEVSEYMSDRQWKYCVIGGLAVQRWGRPRTTLDADFTLFTGWGEEAPYITDLLDHFESRVTDGPAFSLAHRIVLIRTSNGTDADIALGALQFEAGMIERALPQEFAPGCFIPCCTPEDLFVMKAFADRVRDWQDAQSLVDRQPQLDRGYVLEQLAELCEIKESPETLARARALLESS
ncbi:MAG: nucleotidyl transferase AbiEii/AbiGii toxin family protein [Candidatus Hydrogenedentes bacterium]|nr:nucleotidyl transferase AbiEii/AbiGii toxin family protein [Candidatus Hydrogenedentota bacterium]